MFSVDKKLFYSVSILTCFGAIFVYSLSAFTVLYYGYETNHFFIRQLLIGMFGILVMWALSQINPNVLLTKNLTAFEMVGFGIFFVSAFLIIIMPMLPTSVVPLIGGARRWIKIFGFSLAPVEFFKVGIVFFLAWSFNRKIVRTDKQTTLLDEAKVLIPYMLLFFIVVFLIAVLQKDFGQTMVIAIVLGVLAIYAGTSKRIFGILLLLFITASYYMISTSPHRIKRVESWWVTNQDFFLSILPKSVGENLKITGIDEPYQITHSLNAINHGGFDGVGLGFGTFKLGFLSEVHTDFVLAGIAEEWGFMAIFLITMTIGFIVFRIFQISAKTKEREHHLFALGIGTIIIVSFLINSYGVVSLTPVKGIAVPFLSYGGSSVLALCCGVGMVLMVSKKAEFGDNANLPNGENVAKKRTPQSQNRPPQPPRSKAKNGT